MILIVGLGNPKKKFEATRHNLGFRVIDEFHKKNRDVYLFSDFNYKKKFQALISEGKFNDQKTILAKPQTFMNLSGKSVKSLIKGYFKNRRQFQAMALIWRRFENLWIIHDDIDLPLGKIKISIGRGAGGHKGVESIIKELRTKNFVRFRIGICPKTGKPPKQSLRDATGQAKNVERFVLQKFNKGEEKIVKEVIKKTVEAIEFSLKEGLEKAMNRFNK